MARKPARRARRDGLGAARDPLIDRGGKVDTEALRRAVHGTAAAAGAGEPDVVVRAAEGDDDAPNRVVFELRRDLGKRLDKYLTDRIPSMSRTQLQRLIDEGGVKVNGRKPKASTALRVGDAVEVFVPPPPPSEIQAEDIPLEVLHEDEHLIVLNKQADIIVHPARSHLRGTMINALAHHFAARSSGALSGVGKEFARPGVVHRLDRNTTGVIVFAKHDEAHWQLGLQFEHRKVEKRYLAVVHGRVEPGADVIDLPIGPHPSREKGYREKYVVRHDALGKAAVTIYRSLGSFAGAGVREVGGRAGEFSILEIELKTGRTHQIRVHLSHLGWPIVGDDMYGGRGVEWRDEAGGWVEFRRQALHAALLAFRHPMTGEEMRFQAALPGDLLGLCRSLTGGATVGPAPAGVLVDLGALLRGDGERPG